MKAIQISAYGGPEVLRYVDLPEPIERPGHTLIRVTRAGVNYADTHTTENTYLTPTQLPAVPGGEVAGTTPDGRRVVALVPGGGYAELAVARDNLVFDIPDGITDGQALALVLQGVTAWHLLHTSAHLAAGESVVVHAAAGGGRPVDVVLEMIGGPVFDHSLRALAPFGRLVTFGQASRTAAKAVDPVKLMAASRGVIGFWLGHCFSRPATIAEPLQELFRLTVDGVLRPVIGGEYPLSEAARAHRDLLGRGTVGKLVLDPREAS